MAIEVDLAITNNCNLQCSHCCYCSGEEKQEDLSAEIIIDTLKQLKTMGADELHIAGGEPFVRVDLPKIVLAGKRLGYTVQVLSNGYKIKREQIEELKNCGLDRILFSIDDVGYYHDKFRNRKGVFESTINSIRICKELGFFTRVNTVVTNDSMKRMPELNQILEKEGVNRHSLFVLTPIGRGSQLSSIAPDLAQWDSFKTMMKNYAEKAKPKMEISAQKLLTRYNAEKEINTVCRIHQRDDCVISASGEIYPCYIYTSTGISLGNIKNQNIRDIWLNENNWERYASFCLQKCKHNPDVLCNGGCSGYVETVNKFILDCDSRCKIKEGYVPDCVRVYEQLWKGD